MSATFNVNIYTTVKVANMHIQQQGESVPPNSSPLTLGNTELTELITELKRVLPILPLQQGGQHALTEQLHQLEQQSTAPRVQPSLIKDCLYSIRSILQTAATSVITHELLTKLNLWLK